MNERLCNEHALAPARRLVEVVRPALREEEVADCFAEFLALLKEGLTGYDLAVRRMEARLAPLHRERRET